MFKGAKKFLIVAVCVAVVFSLTRFAICEVEKKDKLADDLYSQIELFSYALTTVQAAYTEEPSSKDLIYGALKGMLSSLDPHSQFLTPEDFNDLKTETEGKFGGLGIEISIRDNLLTVVTPLEDTPAWKAGIKALDKIVKIDSESTKDIALNEAVKKLRGKPGTTVNLTIFRESESKILEFTITREMIHIHDVKDVMILSDNIGYIRLTEFREDSYKEFKKGLKELQALKADSLILDLRNNPGGLLSVAIN
ncbi:MAG: S41 family peptidase, partial [Candidatus Omnitrophica bacterium]|nr:S41 family peptidase [Candidatus Omnitrophota bacterium]